MHYPRAPTEEQCNKERAPTQEPAGALKTKGVTARVSGFVLCSGWPRWFLFLWCSSPRPGPGFLVLVSRSWSVSSPCCGPWFLVVSFRGPEVVKKFEEQAGADSITELSSGAPWDAVADMVWVCFITDTILERLGYDFSAVFPMVYFVLAIGHVGHAGVAKLVKPTFVLASRLRN